MFVEKIEASNMESVNLENANTIEIEKTLVLSKGKEMSFEEADALKCNVYFTKSESYKRNCQCCVVAYELRRRGFNVTAMPNRRIHDSIPFKLSMKTESAWIDSRTGQFPRKQKIDGELYENGKWVQKSIADIGKELLDLTKETGRYHINFKWKAGSPHILTLERLSDGGLVIYDPQDGTILKFAELMSGIRVPRGIDILKVDKLLINTEIIKGAVQSTSTQRSQ